MTTISEAIKTNAERARRIYGGLFGRFPLNLTSADRSAQVAAADELQKIFETADTANTQVVYLARAARELVEVLQVATHLQPVEREPYLTAIHRFLVAIEREVA